MRPDLQPPPAPRVRKSRGKRSGHAPPPWTARAQPVPGLASAAATTPKLQQAVRALLTAADQAGRRARKAGGRRTRGS